jgi:uncharacterized iron-regulated membrane protein
MRIVPGLVLCAAALAACDKTAHVHTHVHEPALHVLAPEMTITLQKAIAAAAKAAPGTAVEAGLESRTEPDRRDVWVAVTVVGAGGTVQVVRVGAADAKVLGTEPPADAAATAEAKAVAAALGTAHLALDDLVSRGEKALGGKALRARFVLKDGKAAVRVRALVGAEMQSVGLDPKTGAVETSAPASGAADGR